MDASNNFGMNHVREIIEMAGLSQALDEETVADARIVCNEHALKNHLIIETDQSTITDQNAAEEQLISYCSFVRGIIEKLNSNDYNHLNTFEGQIRKVDGLAEAIARLYGWFLQKHRGCIRVWKEYFMLCLDRGLRVEEQERNLFLEELTDNDMATDWIEAYRLLAKRENGDYTLLTEAIRKRPTIMALHLERILMAVEGSIEDSKCPAALDFFDKAMSVKEIDLIEVDFFEVLLEKIKNIPKAFLLKEKAENIFFDNFKNTENDWNTRAKSAHSVRRAIKIFNSAVAAIPTEAMYDYYLDYVANNSKITDKERPELWRQAVLKAIDADQLSIPCCQAYYESIVGFKSMYNLKRRVLEYGTKKNGQVLRLWIYRVALELDDALHSKMGVCSTWSAGHRVFEQALMALPITCLGGEEFCELWDLMLGHLKASGSHEDVNKMYARAIHLSPQLARAILPHYLRWYILTYGVNSAHTLKDLPVVTSNAPPEFFVIFLEFKLRCNTSQHEMRKLFKEFIPFCAKFKQFWTLYIWFECYHHEADQHLNCNEVFVTALHYLPTVQADKLRPFYSPFHGCPRQRPTLDST